MREIVISVILAAILTGCGSSVTGAKVEIDRDRLEHRDCQTTTTTEIKLVPIGGKNDKQVDRNNSGKSITTNNGFPVK